MPKIERLWGREILDSRGKPTILATCMLEGGASASASVPSGASTGTAEAFELRDGDPKRYRGLGCRQAAANIGGALNYALAGRVFPDQSELDRAMIALDGTPTKSRIGANAILAVSIAFARAQALQRQLPLYRHFSEMLGSSADALPRLTINLFSGGKHAGQQVSIQDVLIIPMSAQTVDEALVAAFDVYQAAAELVFEKYGMRLLTADEGGLAPPFKSVEEMFAMAVEAIKRAGYAPGKDIALGVDVASTHFYRDGVYELDSETLDSPGMIQTIAGWLERFPIISVEDGLAEDDWGGWQKLTDELGGKVQLAGDDLFVTNTRRLQEGIDKGAGNSILIKVNQIGTLTETLDSIELARRNGFTTIISHRSGETEDVTIADIAVATNAGQIKTGSASRTDRVAKYNQLLRIEEDLKDAARYGAELWPKGRR